MDILQSLYGENTQVDLSTLIKTEDPKASLPLATIRNRAATATLLNPEGGNPSENYQLMVNEGLQGDSTTQQKIFDTVNTQNGSTDMKGVMEVLSDPHISVFDKEQIIKGIKKSQFLKDPSVGLLSKSLAKESKGENPSQESSRLTISGAIREIYDSMNQIQGLVNTHAASLDSSSNLRNFAEFVDMGVVPFATAKAAETVATAQAARNGAPLTLWQRLKSGLLAGNTIADKRKQLEAMPPAQRADFVKGLLEDISQVKGMIVPGQSGFAQYQMAEAIVGDSGYSSLEKFLDNAAGVLDIVGLGFTARGLKKGLKMPKEPIKPLDATVSATTPVNALVSPFETTRVAKQDAATSAIRKQEAFDPNIPTPDSNAPTGPIPGILSERTPGVSFLEGGSGVKTVAAEEPQKQIAALFRRIETNNTVRVENPASPAKIVQQANPEQARALHAAVVSSEGDAVAEALYGTTRVDAIASDILPQAIVEDGRVTTRPVDIQRNLREELNISPDLTEMANSTGGTHFTPQEVQKATANITRYFRNAEGLTVNDAMSSFTRDGNRLKISAVYGTPEGGFLNAEEAVRQARLALSQEGVLDSEITILRKEGMDHVPTTLDEVRGKDGNYLVRVDTFHEFDPTDITAFDKVDVKRNFLDRFSGLISNSSGSAARWVMDAASMLHPVYTGAASVVSDITAKFDKFLLGVAGEFSDARKKLSGVEQAQLDRYIKEANYNGIKLDVIDLAARGWTPDMINTIKSWRKFWDSHFYLENYDVVRTLNAQGFQFLDHPNAQLYAKPITKNSTIGKVYDPALDAVVVLTKQELDDLYAKGGNYAKLRRPENLSGEVVEHIMVRNTPTEYMRKLRDSDRVLNYREGYYQIQYRAPKFVDEILSDGTVKAIAVAGDTAEAEHFAQRMRGAAANGETYKVRGDDRALIRGSDDWWDVESAYGRIAQRQRGKLLEDASGLNHLGDGSYIMNPVDSAIRAAQSIAGRTIARPMLEAAKARAIAQYGHMYPTNGIGGVKWPQKLSEIGEKGNFTGSELRDARTTWEYIHYLENGYINSADQLFKAGLNYIGDLLGSIGASKLERGVHLFNESGGPVNLARKGVFTAYLAMNPLRQMIVQPHQALRTLSYNPIGWINGGIPKFSSGYLAAKAGLPVSAEVDAFVKFIDESGFMASVDRQNLVRGTLEDAAKNKTALGRAVSSIGNVPRKIGFDSGEMANMLVHGAAVYENYLRSGKSLTDKAIRDTAYAETRAISYGMNFAGDMPYNQTTPSLLLQFAQVPHKALLQLTNRQIPLATRFRMLSADLLMWGTPAALIANTIGEDVLSEDKVSREVVLWGLESMLLNNMFRSLSDTDTNVDFSSLAPYDLSGWGKFFTEMYSGGISQVLLNSPAGQLYFKDGSRSEMAMKAMARYFGVLEDPDQKYEDFTAMLSKVAEISSGWANWIKADLMLKTGKKLDQYGIPIDKQTTNIEAVAQLFGFPTADSRDLMLVSRQFAKDNKAFKDDVVKAYQDIKRYYGSELEIGDPHQITQISGWAMQAFGDNPEAMAIIQQELSRDLQGKDQALLYLFLKRSGVPTPGAINDAISQMPISDEEKKNLKKIADGFKDSYKQLEQLKKDKK